MRTTLLAIGLLLGITVTASSQEPICVIDGVRVATSVCARSGGLDPSRIASVEVLKGRAATDAWGADAANGVILIRTSGAAGGVPSADRDPFARSLFPPELVMTHQQAINLTERQRSAIQTAVREAQAQFVDLQFAVSREAENLQRLLDSTSVDEAAVLQQVDRVLAAERLVKRAQLTLMLRVKNQLDETQQMALRMLRR